MNIRTCAGHCASTRFKLAGALPQLRMSGHMQLSAPPRVIAPRYTHNHGNKRVLKNCACATGSGDVALTTLHLASYGRHGKPSPSFACECTQRTLLDSIDPQDSMQGPCLQTLRVV
eukprot:798998-Amphidinium_carterae.1